MNKLLRTHARLYLILLTYVMLALWYSMATPLWEAPDEPSHFLYARYLASQHALPPPQPPQRGPFYLYGYATSLYEWYQQPLYYALVAPLVAIADIFEPPMADPFPPINSQFERGAKRLFVRQPPTSGSPLAPRLARLFSIVIGVVTLLATYRLARVVTAGDETVALTATGFMAFIPQFTFLTAYITNDNLANLMATLTMSLSAHLLAQPRTRAEHGVLVLGLLVALALLTKLSLLFALPLGLGALTLRAWSHRTLGLWARETLVFIVSALLPPLLAVLILPGMSEQLAFANLTLQVKPQFLSLDYIAGLWPLTNASFWGRFGWMTTPTPDNVVLAFDLLTLLGLGGAVYGALRSDGALRRQLLLLAAVCALIMVGFIRFNLTVRQPQGRLLYPALSALTVLIAFGIVTLAGKFRGPAGMCLVGVSLALNLVSLLGTLIPAFEGS